VGDHLPLSGVMQGFAHSRPCAMNSWASVPSSKPTHLCGCHSHFQLLLNNKKFLKPVHTWSKCCQALTTCAQLPSNFQCLHLVAQRAFPKAGNPSKHSGSLSPSGRTDKCVLHCFLETSSGFNPSHHPPTPNHHLLSP
jgi:hypothetical protein